MKKLIIPILYFVIQDNMNVQVTLVTKDTVYISTSWSHQCNWNPCTLKGMSVFHCYWPNTTHQYWYDKTHFYNPSLQRKQVDSVLTMGYRYPNL